MIINFEILREVDVSKEVCLWNTWDHEHLFFVHRQFKFAKIIFEDSNVAFIKTQIKAPFLPLYFSCLHTMTSLNNGDVLVIDTLPFGIFIKLEMRYREIGPKKTILHNLYSLNIPFFFYPIKSFLPKMIQKWNDTNWEEDMPLKLRRQQAIDLGFRDFYGRDLKGSISRPHIKLPLPRTKNSVLNIK